MKNVTIAGSNATIGGKKEADAAAASEVQALFDSQ